MDAPEVTVNPNPQLQSYYNTVESRLGYRVLLGGTRHFGFWDHDTHWPFPLSQSLRRMEDKLAETLSLPRGSHVLDAGCGVGHVALRMATQHGLSVSAVDVVPHHVEKARRNVNKSKSKLEGKKVEITVQHADYHHLDFLPDSLFDGIYTMETLVHATDPESVLAGFFRLVKPGGHLALFEYDHSLIDQDVPEELAATMQKVNLYSAMPTNARSHPGVFKAMLEDAGFTDVVVRDYSENIKPMTRLFYALAVVPYKVVKILKAEKRFVNTVAGVGSWKGREKWRYVAISAVKPGDRQETGGNTVAETTIGEAEAGNLDGNKTEKNTSNDVQEAVGAEAKTDKTKEAEAAKNTETEVGSGAS
ncbi:S-adenosyl-L-methionine-dependent methyltransferase [Immersiella caudata]|uniref:S-adenosyl-L-methionine-dependent methyltransferase n=1 Tax=Immersiella caudata TaxID=314043 RepID=A0AA40BWF8_9PEZI|nr:S-adenosyl-L-methionine-dependent methyltransferase [Immersiella caudata]